MKPTPPKTGRPRFIQFRKTVRKSFLLAGVLATAWPVLVSAQLTNLIQIPGPNPILMCGTPGAWDESVIEACDVIKEAGAYYFFYHGVPMDLKLWGPGGYRIGLATSPHPLGPWTKFENRPVLGLGSPGSWDDHHVACAMIVKEAPGKFIMWYSGYNARDAKWDVGLAFASKLTGPWTKYEKNPILRDFGYVGGVVKHNGKYFLYTEHPIDSIAPDYGPISVATGDQPEGPWTIGKDNPALPPSEKGAWDDGGYSEGKVFWRDGLFHLFYGGAKTYTPRIKTRESIGYASSRDGFHFTRHPANPIAPREAQPNAAAFAEVHTLVEPPFIYAFHTLRYIDSEHVPHAKGRTSVLEDLGVQVLVTQRSFKLPMPVCTLDSLPAGSVTELSDCPPICLLNVSRITLTIACEGAAALRVHVSASRDGIVFDATDLMTFDCLGRRTVELKPKAAFIKVRIKNLDGKLSCRKIQVTALLEGE